MLTTIKAHLDSIVSNSQYATLKKTDGLDLAPGLTDLKELMLKLTLDKEVGAVLLYDPEKQVVEISDVVHGDESSCNILFPDPSKLGNKIVIGDVHTHPPTKHYKKTVYLAPSFEDLVAAGERFEKMTGIFKFYMMSLIVTVNEVYVILVTAPLRKAELVTHLKSKNLHQDHMTQAKGLILDSVLELQLLGLYDSLSQQQDAFAPRTATKSEKKFWRADVEGNTMSAIVKIIEEGAPGYAQMLYDTSLAQCVGMLQGTSLTLLRCVWSTSDKLTKVQYQRSPQLIMQTYKAGIESSALAKKGSAYKTIDNPTKGMFYSPSVGLRCCQCLKVHQWTFSTVWGRWHKCNSCQSIFCASCGDKLPWKSTFSRGRKCRYFSTCGGETELLS